MNGPEDDEDWPPNNLAAYYQSARFLGHLRTLQRRLVKAYHCEESESIVFDAAADVLLKEIQEHSLYGRYCHRFLTEPHFIKYIYESCCRKVIDKARSFQRRFRQLLDEESIEYAGPGPEDILIEAEERVRATRTAEELELLIIRKMPKLDRLILKYRIEGMSFQAIADLLDIGVATAHRRHHAAITKLAEHLESVRK